VNAELLFISSLFSIRIFVAADIVTAQTIAYRQANLASNLSNVANNVTPGLADPWGLRFFPASHSSWPRIMSGG